MNAFIELKEGILYIKETSMKAEGFCGSFYEDVEIKSNDIGEITIFGRPVLHGYNSLGQFCGFITYRESVESDGVSFEDYEKMYDKTLIDMVCDEFIEDELEVKDHWFKPIDVKIRKRIKKGYFLMKKVCPIQRLFTTNKYCIKWERHS